jgi:hypothetical protein
VTSAAKSAKPARAAKSAKPASAAKAAKPASAAKSAKPARADNAAKTRTSAASSRRKTTVASPRRPRAGGRREQFLKLVNDRPGISVPEIGKVLNVDPTGLYRYANQLAASGMIAKSGTELHPAS